MVVSQQEIQQPIPRVLANHLLSDAVIHGSQPSAVRSAVFLSLVVPIHVVFFADAFSKPLSVLLVSVQLSEYRRKHSSAVL